MNVPISTNSNFELLHAEGSATPIKGWVRGVPIEASAQRQLQNLTALPFVGPWVAVMPDVHLGIGATVGSVVPTRGAIIPAAVGVDIGCGMAAVRTTLRANDLPDSLRACAATSSAPCRSQRPAANIASCRRPSRRASRSRARGAIDAIKHGTAPPPDKLAQQKRHARRRQPLHRDLLDEGTACWQCFTRLRGHRHLIGTTSSKWRSEQVARPRARLPSAGQGSGFFMQGEPLFDDYVEAVRGAGLCAPQRESMMLRGCSAAMRQTLRNSRPMRPRSTATQLRAA